MLFSGKIVKAMVVSALLGSTSAWGADAAPVREFSLWDRMVRGFRGEHNFAATTGYLSGSWQVGRFGPLKSTHIGDVGFWTRWEYSYHLQIYQGLGYLVGSSLGTTYTRTSDSALLKPPTSFIYPGVVAGLVYNISPRIRVLGAGSINLERFDDLKAMPELPEAGEASTISITMESYDGMAAIDIFAAINLAIRIEGHERFQLYRKPRNAEDKAVNADLERLDRWYGAGLVYHML